MLNNTQEDGSKIGFKQFLQKAQYCEYKLSNYIDKSAESLFGFVSVLPGAYSMFRWEWINGTPLQKFLKGQKLTSSELSFPSCYVGNQYLAEDRLMCLEIVAKEGKDFFLKYIPGCKALTDVPLDLKTWLKQRRRWFNGSMFASFEVINKMLRTLKSIKSIWKNLFFLFLYIYLVANVLVSFWQVGIFYASFSILLRSVLPSSQCTSISHIPNILENVYLLICFFILILSWSASIDYTGNYFKFWAIVMCIFPCIMVGSIIAAIIMDELNILTIVSLCIIFGIALPMILHWKDLKIWKFIQGSFFLFLFTHSYINMMTIYSIWNIHDISWGSRPKGEK